MWLKKSTSLEVLRNSTKGKEDISHSNAIYIYSLDAALLRQVVYGTLRLGIYYNLTEWMKVK